MEQVNIGIIGGSGLYQMPELENVREVPVETPFGKPSDAFIVGELEGVTVAFLAASRPRAQTYADGASLSGEHLRDEAARRRVHLVGLGGRQLAGEIRPDGFGDPGPVF